jgi:hypothetical protein
MSGKLLQSLENRCIGLQPRNSIRRFADETHKRLLVDREHPLKTELRSDDSRSGWTALEAALLSIRLLTFT